MCPIYKPVGCRIRKSRHAFRQVLTALAAKTSDARPRCPHVVTMHGLLLSGARGHRCELAHRNLKVSMAVARTHRQGHVRAARAVTTGSGVFVNRSSMVAQNMYVAMMHLWVWTAFLMYMVICCMVIAWWCRSVFTVAAAPSYYPSPPALSRHSCQARTQIYITQNADRHML